MTSGECANAVSEVVVTMPNVVPFCRRSESESTHWITKERRSVKFPWSEPMRGTGTERERSWPVDEGAADHRSGDPGPATRRPPRTRRAAVARGHRARCEARIPAPRAGSDGRGLVRPDGPTRRFGVDRRRRGWDVVEGQALAHR